MSCQVTLSHFTAPPWMGSGIGTWQHHAVLGTRIYVAITYLTYAGEDVTVVTCDGVPMQKHHVSEDAFGQFHTLEVFSALAIGTGPVTIQTSFNVFRAASWNIANGPADGGVVGVYTAMSGVTTRYLYGFGHDPNALVLGWCEVWNEQTAGLYACIDGIPLHSAVRFAVGYKQGTGDETMLAFDTNGDTANGEQFSFVLTIPSACEAVSGGMKYPWFGRLDLGSGGEELALPHCDVSLGIDTIEGHNQQGIWMPVATTLRNLRINVQTPPGGTASREFWIYKNGVKARRIGTIIGTEDDCALEGVDISFPRWTRVTLRSLVSGVPAATIASYSIEAETAEVGTAYYGPARYGSNNSAPGLGATGHANPFMPISSGGGSDWTLARSNEGRIGIDGTLVGVFLVYRGREIGPSKYDFYVWTSTDDGATYVRRDATYRSLTRPFGATQPGTSFWYVPVDVPVLVGHQAFIALTGADNTGGGLSQLMLACAVFRATTNGQWFYNGESSSAHERFYQFNSNKEAFGFDTESPVEVVTGPFSTPVVITGVNWALVTPPGLGQSRSQVFRVNGADAIVAPIVGTSLSGNAGPARTLALNDRFNMKPGEPWTTQPNWQQAWWTITGFMEPPPANGGNGGNGGGGDEDCPEQVSAGCWAPHQPPTVKLDGDYDR